MNIGSRINSLRDNTNAWLNLVVKLVIICVGIMAIGWMAISIYANFQEYNFTKVKNDVSIEKAGYEFKIKTTGEILLCQDFDSVESGDRLKYILHGYYKIIGDKWKFTKSDLSLDENYFGKIEYQLR